MEVPVGQAHDRAMKRNLVMVLTIASIPGVSNVSAVEGQPLTIRVMDYAGLSAATIEELESTAHRILSSAGVGIAFIDCYTHRRKSGAESCSATLGRAEIVLRILRPRFAVNGEQLGYVAMTPEGGGYATVFIDPEREKARIGALTNGNFLGHAVAHEIGHLLLGADSHSPSGIMRPVWRPVDEEWMVKNALLFSKGQAIRMQMAIPRFGDGK